jgi:hypothetical protein
MKLRQLVSIVVACGLSIACSTRPASAPAIPQEDLDNQALGPVFEDPSLSSDLEVGQVQAVRLPTGKLRLNIPLQNILGDRLEIQVKVVFKDETGMVIQGDETSYQYLGLGPGSHWHNVTSLRQNASKYSIHIRRHGR